MNLTKPFDLEVEIDRTLVLIRAAEAEKETQKRRKRNRSKLRSPELRWKQLLMFAKRLEGRFTIP